MLNEFDCRACPGTISLVAALLVWVLISLPAWGQTTTPPPSGAPKASTPPGGATLRSSDAAPLRSTSPAKATANKPASAPAVNEVAWFPVTQFAVSYWRTNKGCPSLDPLLKHPIQLSRASKGYVAPSPTLPKETITLGARFTPGTLFGGSAIRMINEEIVKYFNEETGLLGVFVTPSEDDIDPSSLRDLRPGDRTSLRLIIYVNVVKQLRTLAFGDRVPAEKRENNPVHRRILENSPVGPASMSGGQPPSDLMRREDIEDYVFRLNRHPGRRVDVARTSTSQPGEVTMDYLVTESKPWLVYAQANNAGTKETRQCRQRFGFIHNQLTNNDDILMIDYATASFDETEGVIASYEAPFLKSQWLRWRVFGAWSRFTASDVGIGNLDFLGRDWQVGGEFIANVYQHRQLFVDLILGTYCRRIFVNNQTIAVSGRDSFLMPYGGVRVEQTTEKHQIWGSIIGEGNWSALGDTGSQSIQKLGRDNVSRHWLTMKWDTGTAFYLEPLLCGPQVQKKDAPEVGRNPMTLAHEIFLQFRGQYDGGYRLVPEFQEVVGGMNSVRGYPESIAVGDNVMLATAEYRFHVPRALLIQRDPSKTKLFGRPFRVSPQEEFGRADWDLIARTFFDMGRVRNNNSRAGEFDETLMSWGIGLELQILQNVSLRCDWGLALRDMNSGQWEAGDSRVHVSAAVMW